MEIPVGSIVVIDSYFNHYVVGPYPYEVVRETAKSLELICLNHDGTRRTSEDNTKTLRKSSVVAVLKDITEFEPFKKLNDETSEKYDAYQDAMKKLEAQVKKIKSKTHGK